MATSMRCCSRFESNGSVRTRRLLEAPLLFGALVLSSASARAQCLDWEDKYFSPGMDAEVTALLAFDDGSGPALYAQGPFFTAGTASASGVARWDGSDWFSVAAGQSHSTGSLAVFDDGSGPALHSGPRKLVGADWTTLGGGVNGTIYASTVFDDGSGPAYYVGGLIDTAGGVSANRIAKWNGTSWSALGSGMAGGPVNALAVYDDGSGPALYAGGGFGTAGGIGAAHIAKWNGTSWSALGSGTQGSGASTMVNALTVFDDGSGAALIAGGVFVTAGGVTVNNIAKWNGTSWSSLGGGTDDDVRALTVHDDGDGAALYAGGYFASAGAVSAARLARWNGTSWSALGVGTNGPVYALTSFDDGNGAALCVGGNMTLAGGAYARIRRAVEASDVGAVGRGWQRLQRRSRRPSVVAPERRRRHGTRVVCRRILRVCR